MVQRTLLLLLLLTAVMSCGCSAPRGRTQSRRPAAPPTMLQPAPVVYTAGGESGTGKIAAMAVQPGTQQRYVVLMEWARQDREGIEGRYRLLRLDVSTGDTQELGPVDTGEAGPRDIACAANGRIAVEQESDLEETRIRVREPGGAWRAAYGWMAHDLPEPIGWTSDSKSLLCRHFRTDSFDAAFTALTSASLRDPFRERSIAHRVLQNATWSADGSRCYALAFSHTGGTLDLLSVGWPSGHESLLLRGSLGDLSVAEENGTFAFIRETGADGWEVWSVPRGARPGPTPVVLPSVPAEFALSPDGRYAAAVLGKVAGDSNLAEGGVAVYRLRDGAEYRIPDTVGKNVMMLHWVLGGRAVIYTAAPSGVLSWESKAMGTQVWVAEVSP
jgi:hypothetical protein